ncbi:hypothetical protein SDC9_191529 [bioreactor metagenome]|uniref:Uncharacterized protein n=1 Tax=bioreactor metagenome TaxID=1076179 RepID=A0A645HY87_9ZZZZ
MNQMVTRFGRHPPAVFYERGHFFRVRFRIGAAQHRMAQIASGKVGFGLSVQQVPCFGLEIGAGAFHILQYLFLRSAVKPGPIVKGHRKADIKALHIIQSPKERLRQIPDFQRCPRMRQDIFPRGSRHDVF